MAYIPNYDSIVESADTSVDKITVSNNTVDNYEQNASNMGVNVVKDINGNVIGYSTNVSQTRYENGEYVERTIQVPLYPSINENSTEENIIIDYKPYGESTSSGGDTYNAGSATMVLDRNDYMVSVLGAAGINVDTDTINTEILDALWENYKDDVTHKGSLVTNPILAALMEEAHVPDPTDIRSDEVALGKLRIEEDILKFIDTDDNIAKLLKAAASVGLITVEDIIEDDPVTRDLFRYHLTTNDTFDLVSPSGNGSAYDTNWLLSFIRPMLYAGTVYPSCTFPSNSQWNDYKSSMTNNLLTPIYLDNNVLNNVNKHVNFWINKYGTQYWTGNREEVSMCGFYIDPVSCKGKVVSNSPTLGFATITIQGTYYRQPVRAKGFKSGNWTSAAGGSNAPTNFLLVYCVEDFLAYLSTLGSQNGSQLLNNNFFIFANCKKSSSIPGVTKGENPIRITANSTVAEIKTQMQQQYPDWYGTTIINNEYNINNNTTNPVTYYPIAVGNDNQPQVIQQTGGVTREIVEKNVTNNYSYTYNQTPKDPSPLPDSEPAHGRLQSNKFWTVYSPTNSQLNELGQHLWNQNAIDILKQTFVNPTDGIISFHQIYVTPEILPQKPICMGVYNTGVNAGIVEEFVKTIECGYVTVPKYYNDVRDYTETRVSIYLPFIGIQELDPRDVIGYALRLRYKIDILTGTCVAYLSPNKKEATQDNHDSNLSSCSYIFTGNCAVQLPITAADRSRMLSGIVIGGVGGAKAGSKLGHPILGGAIGGAIGAAQGLQSEVYRSNGFQANAGALALTMIPYVIVQRNRPADAYQYPKFYGKPNNVTIALQLCQGFTRVKEVIFNTVNANEIEKAEIDRLLKEGIII